MKHPKIISFLVCAALMSNTALAAAIPGAPQGEDPIKSSKNSDSVTIESTIDSEDIITPSDVPAPSIPDTEENQKISESLDSEKISEPDFEGSDTPLEETPVVDDHPVSEDISQTPSESGTEQEEGTLSENPEELPPEGSLIPPVPEVSPDPNLSEQSPSEPLEDPLTGNVTLPSEGEGTPEIPADAPSDSETSAAPIEPQEPTDSSESDQNTVFPEKVTDPFEENLDSEGESKEIQLELDNPVEANEDGRVLIFDQAPIDFMIPEMINGEPVQRIGAGAFRGCEFFRTVVIPASVVEIGEYAFADCENLEQIILLGRSDLSDLTVHKHWSGGAEIIYGIQHVSDRSEQDEDMTEPLPGIFEEGEVPAVPENDPMPDESLSVPDGSPDEMIPETDSSTKQDESMDESLTPPEGPVQSDPVSPSIPEQSGDVPVLPEEGETDNIQPGSDSAEKLPEQPDCPEEGGEDPTMKDPVTPEDQSGTSETDLEDSVIEIPPAEPTDPPNIEEPPLTPPASEPLDPAEAPLGEIRVQPDGPALSEGNLPGDECSHIEQTIVSSEDGHSSTLL